VAASTTTLDAVERLGEPGAGDHVHPGRPRDRHDLVAALGEHLGDVPPEPSGRAGNCDLHAVLRRGCVPAAMTGGGPER
jgi:hypothetical protein